MGKLSTIIALIKVVQPFLKELMPLVKAMIEAIKGAKDGNLVGAGVPVSASDVTYAVDALCAAGMPKNEAQNLIAV